jgi:hypothetical protein
MLFKAGNTSIELQAVEQHLRSELRSHNPMYENLQDAVTKALQLPWWRWGTYAPFVVIWCPGTR